MKKGFTLVELLAVIAILAILVIIALPNVMGMFNTAKENSFKTEVKEVFKVAQQTWMQDSMFNTDTKVYSRVKNESCTNSLDLSGRSDLEYYIVVDKSGRVTEYYATDGTFQYVYDEGDLKIEKITEVQKIADLEYEDDKVIITCDTNGGSGSGPYTGNAYFFGEIDLQVGDSIESIERVPSIPLDSWLSTPGYVTNRSNIENNFYIKANVQNNIISSLSLCLDEDREYCLTQDSLTGSELEAMKNYALSASGTCGTGYCTYDSTRFDYNPSSFGIQHGTALFCAINDNKYGCFHD